MIGKSLFTTEENNEAMLIEMYDVYRKHNPHTEENNTNNSETETEHQEQQRLLDDSGDFAERQQEKYNSLKYEDDRSPQWDPQTPHETLRSYLSTIKGSKSFGVKDEDANLFDFTCNEYKTPDIYEEGWEVEAYHTDIKDVKLAKDGRPLITLENRERWTVKSPNEIRNHPYRKEIMESMQVEKDTLNKYKSFEELEKSPQGKRMITLKWVFKIKFRDGVFEKFKARLCGRGFTQIEGIDYDPEGTSSPVARNSTFMATMAEATKFKMLLKSFDVKCAYLLADLSEDLYAQVPYGMYVDPKTKCLKILKSLYGLKQSGYNWFSKLSNNLIKIGFSQSKVDPCFFTFRRGEEICRICIWVDDGLVSVSSEELWQEIKNKIHKDSPLSQAGPLEWLLGMAIKHDRENSILKISQKTRIEALLERHGMLDTKGKETPLPDEHITKENCPTNEMEERQTALSCGFESYAALVHKMREILGTCGYLSCWGRPDLRQATYMMARYQARPSKRHWQLTQRLLKYLSKTRDLCLTFEPDASKYDLAVLRLEGDHELYGMVDSNYTNADDTKSTTGYVFWFYGCPIVCESKKQRCVTHSTTEAELIAASLATRRCIYLRRLLKEDFKLELKATPLGEDNQGCVHISRGGGSHAKARHMRVADSYVFQEQVLNKTIDMRYVASADNIADIFTKSLGKIIFQKLRNRLMRHEANYETDFTMIAFEI